MSRCFCAREKGCRHERLVRERTRREEKGNGTRRKRHLQRPEAVSLTECKEFDNRTCVMHTRPSNLLRGLALLCCWRLLSCITRRLTAAALLPLPLPMGGRLQPSIVLGACLYVREHGVRGSDLLEASRSSVTVDWVNSVRMQLLGKCIVGTTHLGRLCRLDNPERVVVGLAHRADQYAQERAEHCLPDHVNGT